MPNWGEGARKRIGVLAGAVTLFASLAIAHGFAGPPTFELEIGAAPASTFGNNIVPAVGPSGNVYVLDPVNDRVQVFQPNGSFIREFGDPGSGDGDFGTPSGIAVGANGHVYVGDFTRDIVQEFEADGTFVRRWGSSGGGEGQFEEIAAIAVHPDSGNVFVLDNGSNHETAGRVIQEFGPTGAFVTGFGFGGDEENEFNAANALAFDSEGGLWVADTANHRVQRFDDNNQFDFMIGEDVDIGGVTGPEVCDGGCKIGVASTADGGFTLPLGVAVDSSDNVYITDDDARIQKILSTGAFATSFEGTVGTALGQFDTIGPLAAGGSSLFIADSGNNDRIQRFTTGLDEEIQWGSTSPAATFSSTNSPGFPDIGPNGNVYIPDAGSKVLIFESDGDPASPLAQIPTGVSPTSGVAVAGDGSLYVTVSTGLKHFAADGTPDGGFAPAPPGGFSSPTGVAIHSSGDVFVADTGNDRVLRFRADGTYVSRFGSTGSANGQLNGPEGLAFEPDGNILVVDTLNDRVQRFDPRVGTHLASITGFSEPRDVAIDSNGDMWVTDNTLNRAFNLAPDGTALTQLGTGAASAAEDALNEPIGIAIRNDVFWVTLDFGSAPGRARKYTNPGVTPVPPEGLPPQLPDVDDDVGGPHGGKGGGGGGFTIEDLDEDAEAGVLVKNKQRLNKLKASVICVLGPCNSKLSGRIELTKKIGKGKKDEEAEASAKKKQRTKRQKVKLRRPELSLESGQIKQVRLQPMGKAKKRKATVRKVQRKLKNGWKARAKVKLLSRTPSGVIASRAVISKIKPAK